MTSLRTLPTPWVSVDASRAHVPRLHTDAQSPPVRPPARPPGNGHRELLLPADATAPGVARAFLRCATEEWGVDDDLAQDAAMVITELVANAVDHARTESTLSIGVAHEGLSVSVRDTRPGPVLRPAPIDPTAARGRGLQMVDALTTARGSRCTPGVRPSGRCWAPERPDDLRSDGCGSRTRAASAPLSAITRPDSSVVCGPANFSRRVRLENLPTLVLGTSSMNSTASGSHQRATSGSRCARSSSKVRVSPGSSTTQASGRSTHRSWGTPITPPPPPSDAP